MLKKILKSFSILTRSRRSDRNQSGGSSFHPKKGAPNFRARKEISCFEFGVGFRNKAGSVRRCIRKPLARERWKYMAILSIQRATDTTLAQFLEYLPRYKSCGRNVREMFRSDFGFYLRQIARSARERERDRPQRANFPLRFCFAPRARCRQSNHANSIENFAFAVCFTSSFAVSCFHLNVSSWYWKRERERERKVFSKNSFVVWDFVHRNN